MNLVRKFSLLMILLSLMSAGAYGGSTGAYGGSADAYDHLNRITDRLSCYRQCLDSDGWDPVCVFNPFYTKPTSHGGGSSVWPNMCMANCMVRYHIYSEWNKLIKIKDMTLPKTCKTDMWKIYWLDDRHDYNTPQNIIGECTKCDHLAPI